MVEKIIYQKHSTAVKSETERETEIRQYLLGFKDGNTVDYELPVLDLTKGIKD